MNTQVRIEEEWRKVPGLPEFEASSLGQIKINGSVRPDRHHTRGYRQLTFGFRKWGFRRQFVHRLVALAFHGLPPSERHEVLHLNDNPEDNRAENLKWGTHAENMLTDRGNNHAHKGEKNPRAKLTTAQVLEIRNIYANRRSNHWGASKLAKKFNIHPDYVGRVAKGYFYETEEA